MKLTQKQMEKLAEINNWAAVEYDNNGILVRSLTGGDDATDWMPVTQDQIDEIM